MKKILLVIIALLAIFDTLFANPSIRFERTDVEQNADYVTATCSFGIDIYIDDLPNCSNVAFELSHNLIRFVKFSEMWKSSDWGESGKAVSINNGEFVDSSADKAIISIEAGTGYPASISSPNSPKVVHLEFVVAPTAEHSNNLTFSIGKIKATYFKDTIVELIIPDVFIFNYKIHSYIDVWAGDATCDGTVDTYDDAAVSFYLTDPTYNKRSFKRPFTSILWHKQKCIAWDELPATYADCDGNGFITTSDLAVIKINYNKTHNDYCNSSVTKNINLTNVNIDHAIAVPIYADANSNIAGAAAIIDYSENVTTKILAIHNGGYFSDNVNFTSYINENTKNATFSVCNADLTYNHNPSKPIAIVYVDNSNTTNVNDIVVKDFIGFDNGGYIQPLTSTTTSVANNIVDDWVCFANDNIFYVQSNENITLLTLTNTLGEVCYATNNINHLTYNISHLPSGLYFVVAYTKDGVQVMKVIF